jgi:hypothetical protein
MVGKYVPGPGETQSYVTAIRQIHQDLEPFTVRLTRDQRRHTLKMRTGGEEIVRIVMNQAEKVGLTIAIASTDDVRRDLELLERLEPLQEALDEVRQRIADTILEARSEAWTATLTYYSALVRMARGDGNLERALEPVVAFFAIGPRHARNKIGAESGRLPGE